MRLLGRFSVHAGESVTALPPAAARVVALAALGPSAPSRSKVAATLWPDVTEERAAASLRATLSRLSAACPGLMAADPLSVRLARDVRVDVQELNVLALAISDGDVPETLPLDWLCSQLLPDWDDEWLDFERDRVRDMCLQALDVAAGQLLEQGRYGRATAATYAALRLDPLRESAGCLLLQIYLAQGNRAQAVRYFLDFGRRLRADLGVGPSEAMLGLMGELASRRGH